MAQRSVVPGTDQPRPFDRPTPPGPNVKPAEQLFYDTAVIPNYSFEEEVILFFEPRSRTSREAARRSVDRIAQRTKDRSVPVPVDWAAADLGDKPLNLLFPADAVLEALKTTSIPILHVSGDHDIIFPSVEEEHGGIGV
jgi:hypothetical protein